MAPAEIPGIVDASIDVRVFVVPAALVLVHRDGDRALAGDLRLARQWHAGAAFGARVVTGRQAACAFRAGYHANRTDAGAARRFRAAAAKPVERRQRAPRIRRERVVTMTAWLSAHEIPGGRAAGRVLRGAARTRAGAAGPVSAALSDAPAPPRPPLIGSTDIGVEGRPPDPDAPHPRIGIREVTPQFFETFRIPLVEGRTFQEADWTGEPAAVLNSRPGECCLQASVRSDGASSPHRDRRAMERAWYTVMGVTADIRNGQRVTDEPDPEIYVVARRGTGATLRPSLASHDGQRPPMRTPSSGRSPPTSTRRSS